ncbi:MAG TPA: YihA family ribosome biogenesis GTP-binding protein, partial [Ramlibacter sp.]
MTSPPAPRDATSTAAALAMGWLHTARFLTTAPKLEFLPPLEVPE